MCFIHLMAELFIWSLQCHMIVNQDIFSFIITVENDRAT